MRQPERLLSDQLSWWRGLLNAIIFQQISSLARSESLDIVDSIGQAEEELKKVRNTQRPNIFPPPPPPLKIPTNGMGQVKN